MRPVQGGARHSQVFGYSCGLFSAVCFLRLSLIRSRLIASSIYANAAMAVNNARGPFFCWETWSTSCAGPVGRFHQGPG